MAMALGGAPAPSIKWTMGLFTAVDLPEDAADADGVFKGSLAVADVTTSVVTVAVAVLGAMVGITKGAVEGRVEGGSGLKELVGCWRGGGTYPEGPARGVWLASRGFHTLGGAFCSCVRR